MVGHERYENYPPLILIWWGLPLELKIGWFGRIEVAECHRGCSRKSLSGVWWAGCPVLLLSRFPRRPASPIPASPPRARRLQRLQTLHTDRWARAHQQFYTWGQDRWESFMLAFTFVTAHTVEWPTCVSTTRLKMWRQSIILHQLAKILHRFKRQKYFYSISLFDIIAK